MRHDTCSRTKLMCSCTPGTYGMGWSGGVYVLATRRPHRLCNLVICEHRQIRYRLLPCVRPSTNPRDVGEHCAGFNFSPQTNGYMFMEIDIDFAGVALHRNFLDGQSAREGKAIARIKIGYDRRSAASFH